MPSLTGSDWIEIVIGALANAFAPETPQDAPSRPSLLPPEEQQLLDTMRTLARFVPDFTSDEHVRRYAAAHHDELLAQAELIDAFHHELHRTPELLAEVADIYPFLNVPKRALELVRDKRSRTQRRKETPDDWLERQLRHIENLAKKSDALGTATAAGVAAIARSRSEALRAPDLTDDERDQIIAFYDKLIRELLDNGPTGAPGGNGHGRKTL